MSKKMCDNFRASWTAGGRRFRDCSNGFKNCPKNTNSRCEIVQPKKRTRTINDPLHHILRREDMIVNRKTLTDLNACEDGLKWFDHQENKELSVMVKAAIKEGGEALNYAGWGLCAVMTKEQRIEWAVYSAYQAAHRWKDKYPKEYAIWDTWASGRDRSEAARAAARAAAWAAAGAAAREKTLAKLLRKGVAIVYGGKI